jgi:predicted MFS family arabinose efflux permease
MRPHVPKPKITRAEWALIVLLAAINFTHILDFVIVMPLGKQLISELRISPEQFAHIVSAYGIAACVAGIVAASVVDRFDRRTVLLFNYAGFTVSTLACGLAPDYTWLLVARALAGAFGGVTSSAILAVIGDVFPHERRGVALGAVTSGFAVASIVGLPVGLMLATQFGRGMPFLALAALSVPVWLFAFVRLPSLTAHRQQKREGVLVELLIVARHPNHLRSFLFMFALVMGSFTIIPFLAPYLELNCGQTRGEIALIYAIAGVFTLVGMNVVGKFTDHFGQRPVFLVTAAGSIVMTVVLTNLPAWGLAVSAAAATGFMLMASGRIIPAQAMMIGSSPPHLRGRFMNLNNAVSHFGTGIAPLISGALITQSSESAPLQGYSLAGLVAVVFAAAALGLSFLLRPPHATTPSATEAAELEAVIA